MLKTKFLISISNKDQNPATAGSACINAKEREKKEIKGLKVRNERSVASPLRILPSFLPLTSCMSSAYGAFPCN